VQANRLCDALRLAERELMIGPHPERARLDAETLLLSTLGRSKAWLTAHSDEWISRTEADGYRELIRRRVAGEPVQYILRRAEFYGLAFEVNPDVLIPRPETEHLVEKAIELAGRFIRPRIADVGTGAGAIAIALAHKMPDSIVTAIDISRDALDIAKQNAARNQVAHRIRFLEGDLLSPVAGSQFEIIVSNPPYVPEADRASLAVEVRDYEPEQALFAGPDGLATYRRLIPQAIDALAPGGFVVLEIGYGQRTSVMPLLRGANFHQIESMDDLQGIPRVVTGRRG
jgi:release factor glutamine methyltransferase